MRLSGWRRDERGAVSIMAAASMVAVVGFLALAVDLGAMFLQTRKLQGMADLAAMSAANDLPNAQAAAEATVAANAWPGAVAAEVSTGLYTPDPQKAVNARFTAGAPLPNAARVTLRAPAQVFFGRLFIGDARSGSCAPAPRPGPSWPVSRSARGSPR